MGFATDPSGVSADKPDSLRQRFLIDRALQRIDGPGVYSPAARSSLQARSPSEVVAPANWICTRNSRDQLSPSLRMPSFPKPFLKLGLT
jgi:hypothetical protein